MVAGGDDLGSEYVQPAADPWLHRVAIARSAGRSFAYRPDRVLVVRGPWRRLTASARNDLLELIGGDTPAEEDQSYTGGPVVLTGVADPVEAARRLRDEGLVAQVDHVFFAVPVEGDGVSGAPVMFGGVSGAPVMFGGVGGAPVMFGGVAGAPVMFGGVGCGCCHLDIGPPSGSPAAPRQSTVRPAAAPIPASGTGQCRVVVVDTGLADDPFLPAELNQVGGSGARDEPDADDDGNLDPAAGHATFIAAIVGRLAPGATVEVRQVLSTFGDGSDSDVAATLRGLLDDPPQIVNLSFAGYSEGDTAPMAIRDAVAQLVAKGSAVVAAAGNDATCRPAWPASLDKVVSVGAVGPNGPAWFTNHGSWVRACAPGVDVVSRFFDIPSPQTASQQNDVKALGAAVKWAAWSGTSFAAPIVAGVLARAVLAGSTPGEAVAAAIDDAGLLRLVGLGTVINERPWEPKGGLDGRGPPPQRSHLAVERAFREPSMTFVSPAADFPDRSGLRSLHLGTTVVASHET